MLLTWLFIGFGAMTLIPGYPILCGVFFITLGIYQSFLSAREANDILYSALLPVAKRDVVKGKYQFVMTVELCGFVLMTILTLFRMTILKDAAVYRHNVLMNANLHPGLVQRQGIAGITAEQLADARGRGKTVKLMCRAKKDEFGRVTASVAPEEIDAASLYATVDGSSSAVAVTTDLMGKLTIVEHEPTIIQTAYGVFQDILRLFS